METTVKYPQVKLKLCGEDGNAFAILGRANRAIKQARREDGAQSEPSGTDWDQVWTDFESKATSGNYDELLCTCMEWFDCDGEEE